MALRVEHGRPIFFIGTPEKDEDGTWARIEPPAGEVRYIRASAVTTKPPAPPILKEVPPKLGDLPPLR